MCPLQSTGNLSRVTHHPQLPMAAGGGGFLRCRAFRTVPGPLGQLVSLPQHQWLYSSECGEKTGMKFNRLGSEWELRNVLAGGICGSHGCIVSCFSDNFITLGISLVRMWAWVLVQSEVFG